MFLAPTFIRVTTTQNIHKPTTHSVSTPSKIRYREVHTRTRREQSCGHRRLALQLVYRRLAQANTDFCFLFWKSESERSGSKQESCPLRLRHSMRQGPLKHVETNEKDNVKEFRLSPLASHGLDKYANRSLTTTGRTKCQPRRPEGRARTVPFPTVGYDKSERSSESKGQRPTQAR